MGEEIKLIAVALVYSTNWLMAFGVNSFLESTAITWSLSIEEQFYLVWPLLFFGCLMFKVRRAWIMTGLGATILAIMVHRILLLDAGAGLTRLYYATDTRADALLIGCLMALLPVARVSWKMKKYLNLASVLCVVALFYFMATARFTDPFLYCGGYTLIALMAGIVIFVAANSPPEILSALLRSRTLRWFGKISYGLYLWHWLVVLSSSFYYLGYWEPWAKLALAVGIASTSFYLVEKPFNRLKIRFAMQPRRVQLVLSSTGADKVPSRMPVPLAN
jgi:peptidoglycan/LPS O-acetylase OafA/YrhL